MCEVKLGVVQLSLLCRKISFVGFDLSIGLGDNNILEISSLVLELDEQSLVQVSGLFVGDGQFLLALDVEISQVDESILDSLEAGFIQLSSLRTQLSKVRNEWLDQQSLRDLLQIFLQSL